MLALFLQPRDHPFSPRSSRAFCHPDSQHAPSHGSGGTYTLSSAARSVASDPLPKRGMSPKP